MYTIKVGHGWKYSATTGDRVAAVRIAEALTLQGWGVHVTGPDGATVPWRNV